MASCLVMHCCVRVLAIVSLVLGLFNKKGLCRCQQGGTKVEDIMCYVSQRDESALVNSITCLSVKCDDVHPLSTHTQKQLCLQGGSESIQCSKDTTGSGVSVTFTCSGVLLEKNISSTYLYWTDESGSVVWTELMFVGNTSTASACNSGDQTNINVIVITVCVVVVLFIVISVGFISLRLVALNRRKAHYTINQGVANEIAITEADLPDGHSPPPVPPRTAEMLDLKPSNTEIPSNNTSTTNMVALQGIVHLPTDDDMLEYYNEDSVASLRRDGHPNGDISHQHPSTVISNDLPTTNLTAIENQQHDVPPEESDIPPPIPPRPKKHTYYNTAPLVPPKGSVTPPPTIPPRSYLRPTDQEYTDTVRITKSPQPPYPGSTETLDELPESERFIIERDKLSLNEFLGHQKPSGSDGEDNTCMSTAESVDMWPPPIPRRSDLMYLVKDYNPEVFHVVHNDPIEMKDNVAYKKCQ